MKLMITIINDIDNEAVSLALVECGFRVTRVASTGGFLRKGSTTLMIGIEEKDIEKAVETIRNHTTVPEDKGMSRATIFVLNVADFIHL